MDSSNAPPSKPLRPLVLLLAAGLLVAALSHCSRPTDSAGSEYASQLRQNGRAP